MYMGYMHLGYGDENNQENLPLIVSMSRSFEHLSSLLVEKKIQYFDYALFGLTTESNRTLVDSLSKIFQ